MVSECDRAVRAAIPAVRITVSEILSRDYGMPQEEIAKRLGVTQASVNKYLNSKYSGSTARVIVAIRRAGLDRKIARAAARRGRVSELNEMVDDAAASPYVVRSALALF